MIDVTDDTFYAEVLSQKAPVLVDFWATWCQPCQKMVSLLEDAEAQMGEKIKVVKANVEECGAVAASYSIRSLPTLIVFKNGSPMAILAGAAIGSKSIVPWVKDAIA